MPPPAEFTAESIHRRWPDDLYTAYHAPRYALALAHAAEHWPGAGRALDIGPSRLTGLLAERLRAPVDSLGFAQDAASPTGRHYHFDLNHAQHRDRWRTDLPPYDLVMMGEVIEHLHTAPSLVLAFLRTLLRPAATLIVQTPNAVAAHKRIALLLGRHPYQRILENPAAPGHFREYTLAELREDATRAGFRVRAALRRSYFDYRFRVDRATGRSRPTPGGGIVNAIYACAPAPLRTGITLILARDD